jgi:serine/threonine protein kinase
MFLKTPLVFHTTFSQFTATDILGEGGAGRVYLATDDTDGAAVAIKLLNAVRSSKEKIRRFKNELTFCMRNKHTNILTVIDHGSYTEGSTRSPFYVMPRFDGSLRTLMDRGIAPPQVLNYFAKMVDGVEAAHLQKVIHRDLKPENILYEARSDNLVVADFGIARFEEEELFTLVETSPHTRLANFKYSAPEQRVRNGTVERTADIFALGLLLHEMFIGEVPQGTGYKRIADRYPDLAYIDRLVERMIRQAPADRFASVDEVKQALIAQKNEFVSQQRLSVLKQTVVPTADIDDPIISDPPRVIGCEWNGGTLVLRLSRPINQKWVWALQNMGNYSSLIGGEPERWQLSGAEARLAVRAEEAQSAIDYFKGWLPQIGRKYEERIRQEKQQSEEHQRRILQEKIIEEEKRLKINQTLRF